MLRKQGIAGACFSTEHGPLLIPTNSRSIVESFLRGEYFGATTIRAFLKIGPGAARLINVGANVGTSARLLSAEGQYRKIDCFEPDPTNFTLLQMNTAGRSGFALHNCALGARAEDLPLNLNPDSVGRHSFKTDFGKGHETVQVRSLGDFIDSGEIFDMFMDVEGWEIEVLRGAGEKLSNCAICALEWNGHLHDVNDRKAAVDLLTAARFSEAIDLNALNKSLTIDSLLTMDEQCDIAFVR